MIATLLAGVGCAFLDGIGGGGDDDDDGGIDPPDVPLTNIGELRAIGPGPVDLLLNGPIVTYISNVGFFIQQQQSGPGLFVFEGQPPEIGPGELVTMHVRNLVLFQGNIQIDQFDLLEHQPVIGPQQVEDEFATPIDFLDQSPGTGHESRLISLTGARVEVELQPNNFALSSASNLNWNGDLFSPVATDIGLCAGTSFDLIGVVQIFDGTHQVQASKLEDFRRVSNPCGSIPPPPTP